MRRSKYEKPRPREGGSLNPSAMIASLAAPGQRTKAAPFGQSPGRARQEPARHRRPVGGPVGNTPTLHIFAQAHPERFYQMGMAEQAHMSAAAGLAREGFTPFATTYAVFFAARRAYDFICLAIAEEKSRRQDRLPLPGLTTGYGPSHQATEDLAIFRGMPNLTIIDPLRRPRDRAGRAGDGRP